MQVSFCCLKNILSEQFFEINGNKTACVGREGGQYEFTSWEWKVDIKGISNDIKYSAPQNPNFVLNSRWEITHPNGKY